MDKDVIVETLDVLKNRFEKNMYRHTTLQWDAILTLLMSQPDKLQTLFQMEQTGGEPDAVVIDPESKELIYADCCIESPQGRRSLCYDQEALQRRKQNKPVGSVEEIVSLIGAELMDEDIYRAVQSIFPFDLKSSSWIKTPLSIRQAGGALFCDHRYGRTFTYYNSAESYYSSRGFRMVLELK